MNEIFYCLFAETEHLFFFCCTAQKEFIEEYSALLIHIYQLPQDTFTRECFCTAFAGNPEEIIEIFNKNNGIKEDRLVRVSSILHELDKIFTGQTDALFVYIDGKDEHINQHFELVNKLVPNLKSDITKV